MNGNLANNYQKPTENKTVESEHTEIALEIHMKETEGVLIMQLSLQLSRLDKMICIQHFVMISLSVLCVFRFSSSVKSLRTAA